MGIHSFLKAEKGDPDWQFSPEDYFGKEFKIIEANMIEISDNSSDKVVLRQNPTEKDLLAKRINITVQSNSTLDLMLINEVDNNLQQVFLYDIHLRPGAILTLGTFIKNGKLNKHILQIYLDEGAIITMYGLISNDVSGDTEVVTKIMHNGPDTISNQLFLGLAGKDSQTVFQSTVITDGSSVNGQVCIENCNLITGTNGKCFSRPDTYINSEHTVSRYASEVTTLSEEKLGYMQSKGLKESIAKDLLVSSFRNQVINLISQDNIRDEVKELYTI